MSEETIESGEGNMVRVNNMRPTILHLPDQVAISEGRFTSGAAGKSLQPGGNNIEAHEWERAKKKKTVREWLRLGWLKEGGDTAEPEGPLAPLNLITYGVGTAAAMVEGEDNTEVLRRWAKDEKRPEVLTALKRKLESLGAPQKGKRS